MSYRVKLTDLIARIDRVRDGMDEARRYVRTRDPAATEAACRDLAHAIFDLPLGDRLNRNLEVGTKCLAANPSLLESYLECARWELLGYRGRVEQKLAEFDALPGDT
jgi:hypothetical protein